MSENNRSWMEYFRLITPFMLIVFAFIGWSMNSRLEKLDLCLNRVDEKLFLHLTNDELHTPRNLVVSQEAFTLYQNMREKQLQDIKDGIGEIKQMIQDGKK